MKKPERQVAPEVLDTVFKDYEGSEDWPQVEEWLGFSSQALDISSLSKP
jgi:hypothetical protein